MNPFAIFLYSNAPVYHHLPSTLSPIVPHVVSSIIFCLPLCLRLKRWSSVTPSAVNEDRVVVIQWQFSCSSASFVNVIAWCLLFLCCGGIKWCSVWVASGFDWVSPCYVALTGNSSSVTLSPQLPPINAEWTTTPFNTGN